MEHLPSINRIAIVVSLKKPFIGWLKYIDSGDTIAADGHDTKTIYLLPDDADNEKWQQYVKKHYLEIFEEELGSCCTDPSLWPQERSWEIFQEWLNVEMHSVIFDMVNGDIEKE